MVTEQMPNFRARKQLGKAAKKSWQIFFRFTTRMDRAMTLSVVSASRVYILPKPHFSLARLNFRSTSTRSQMSL